jgi:hypothetical protein
MSIDFNPHTKQVAGFTAFMYAAAAQTPPTHWDDCLFEKWEGHLGFVGFCSSVAIEIVEYLQALDDLDQSYPGVMEYDVLTSLGRRLIHLDHTVDVSQALQWFIEDFNRYMAQA